MGCVYTYIAHPSFIFQLWNSNALAKIFNQILIKCVPDLAATHIVSSIYKGSLTLNLVTWQHIRPHVCLTARMPHLIWTFHLISYSLLLLALSITVINNYTPLYKCVSVPHQKSDHILPLFAHFFVLNLFRSANMLCKSLPLTGECLLPHWRMSPLLLKLSCASTSIGHSSFWSISY